MRSPVSAPVCGSLSNRPSIDGPARPNPITMSDPPEETLADPVAERAAVRDGYDALAETYAADRSDDGVGMDALAALLDRLPADARVLDAGCGQGDPALARLTAETTAVGLDFSASQLALADAAAPTAALVRGDMTALPFDDDAFDALASLYAIIHVPLAEQPATIAEFARVLAPGGLALVGDGASRWCGVNPDWLDAGAEMRWQIAGREATREQLLAAGFEVVEAFSGPDQLGDDEAAPDDPFFLVRLAD